jgi:hypothetical protein
MPQGRDNSVRYRPAIAGTTLQRLPPDANPLGQLEMLAAFDQRIGHYACSTLVVLLGTNDVAAATNPWGLTLDTWGSAWDEWFARVAQLPWRPRVIVIGLPYIGVTHFGGARSVPYGMATVANARDVMDAITADRASEYHAKFVSLGGMTAAMVGPDGIHPNEAGQRYIAQQLIAAVSSA